MSGQELVPRTSSFYPEEGAHELESANYKNAGGAEPGWVIAGEWDLCVRGRGGAGPLGDPLPPGVRPRPGLGRTPGMPVLRGACGVPRAPPHSTAHTNAQRARGGLGTVRMAQLQFVVCLACAIQTAAGTLAPLTPGVQPPPRGGFIFCHPACAKRERASVASAASASSARNLPAPLRSLCARMRLR